jgi:peptidyl-prolyl cis-trans isomerase B (cyclophilin B)
MKTPTRILELTLALGLAAGCQRSEKIEATKSEPVTPSPASTNLGTASNAVSALTAAPSETKTPEPPKSTPQPTLPTMPPNTNEVAVIKTAQGEMVVEFWPDVAPNTVANFIKLAKSGFYDGTCFHRIVKGFMIQGGDPLTKDPSKEPLWGTGDPGYKIKAEFNDRSHTNGVISMARSQDPDSAGCQFFICHGNPTFLDRQYTAFGRLIKGNDVLDKLANTPVVASRSGERSKPTARVNVDSIKIVPANPVQ